MGPVYLEGSCGRGKLPSSWECPSPAGRSARIDRGLERLRGECSSRPVAGRAERDQHNGPGQLTVLPSLRCMPASACSGWIQKLRRQRQTRGEDLIWLHRQREGPGVWCRGVCSTDPGSTTGGPLSAHVNGGGTWPCHTSLVLGMLRAGTALPPEALGAHKCREIAHIWRQG